MSASPADTSRGLSLSLPIFALALLFLVIGSSIRLSGRIEALEAQEAEQRRVAAGRARAAVLQALVVGESQRSLRLPTAETPLGASRFRDWKPDIQGSRDLPLAAAIALDLEAQGRVEEALQFFGHESLQGESLPELALARARCLARVEGSAAAIDALERVENLDDATLAGMPFPLLRAIMIARLDRQRGLELLERLVTVTPSTIPIEARAELTRIFAGSSTNESGPTTGRLEFWLLAAAAVVELRESGLRLRPGEIVLSADYVALASDDEVVLRPRADFDLALGEIERNLRTEGTAETLALARTADGQPTLVEFRPQVGKTSETLDLASNLFFACAALTGLLGGLALIRFARREQRLAALKSDFIDLVSHELRTPLAVMSIKSEMLATGVVPDAKKGAYLRDLDLEVTKLRTLVEGLLDFSRLEKGRFVLVREEVDLRRLLARILRELRSSQPALARRLSIHAPAKEIHIVGDGESLRHSILNLLDNAAKYAGADTKIAIELARDQARVSLAVTDEGPGVPSEIRDRLFERFVRGRHEGVAGSGLGLALVRATAEAHGGRARHVERPKGEHGARFVIELPLGKSS